MHKTDDLCHAPLLTVVGSPGIMLIANTDPALPMSSSVVCSPAEFGRRFFLVVGALYLPSNMR